MSIATILKRAGVKKLLLAAGIVSVVAGGMFALSTQTEAADCPSNDIMPCGASSPSNFIAKLKKNNPSDMDNIYADGRYDLPKSQYDEFAKYAKKAKINPDSGNITVDGVTVVKDAKSIGRNSKGSISTAITINGKKYYQTPIRLLTKNTNDGMVLFDAKGNVQTVIMNLCGNPMTSTEVNPKYNCDALNVSSVDRDTFKFSSKVSASNGATITKVVYDFGDGKTHTEKNPSTVVEHTYAKAGSYTAKVTAYVKTKFGRGEFAITVTADCKKSITVKEEKKPGVTITKTVNGKESTEVQVNKPFTYELTVKNTGNVDLKNVAVTDKAPHDGITFISTDKGSIVNNALQYTIPSLKIGESVTIKITAKATKYIAGVTTNTACVNAPEVNPKEPTKDDDCDTATTTMPEPIKVCELATKTIITINPEDFDATKHSKNLEDCKVPEDKDIVVCRLSDKVYPVTIKESEFDDTKYSKDPNDCKTPEDKEIQVCRLSDKVYPVTIKESEFDSTKYSKNPDDCKVPEDKDITVCRLSDKVYPVTIKESEFDDTKYSKDPADCEAAETPMCEIPGKENLPADSDECVEEEEETPEELPHTGMGENILSVLGAGSVVSAAGAYIASRRSNK